MGYLFGDVLSRKEILYFESKGEINTEETLKISKERGDELGIKDLVVASTRGETGIKQLNTLKTIT